MFRGGGKVVYEMSTLGGGLFPTLWKTKEGCDQVAQPVEG